MPRFHLLAFVCAGILAAAQLAGAPLSDAWGQTNPSSPPAAAQSTPLATPPGNSDFNRSPAPAEAYCYIGWPNDGEVINRTHFKVWFGTRYFGVAPAGTSKPNTGHHHLLIDTDLPPMDQPIPNDKNHLHFGLGQTEAYIDLPPGKHTLQLIMGDADHYPHDPPVISKKITVTVR
jgi:Domain of unknown function (DUF4399)